MTRRSQTLTGFAPQALEVTNTQALPFNLSAQVATNLQRRYYRLGLEP